MRQFEAQSSIDTGDKRSFFGNKSKTERKAGKFVVPPLIERIVRIQRTKTQNFLFLHIVDSLSLLSVPSLDIRGFSYGSDLLFQRTK